MLLGFLIKREGQCCQQKALLKPPGILRNSIPACIETDRYPIIFPIYYKKNDCEDMRMKLSISNIGWKQPQDDAVYELMKQYGFTGLEIAPTRIFPEAPYEDCAAAKAWSQQMKRDFGFVIPSMQSIWYGRQENIFGSVEERQLLLDYTKKAIDFAAAIGCHNLVFGCPRNRNLPEGVDAAVAVPFFKELGDYAASQGTVIGMEANPPIYNTNFVNDTLSALALIKEVDSSGFKLNLDVGTMIQNEEQLEELVGQVSYINHVHISEPGLKPIEARELHKSLLELLVEENYDGYVSIEMGTVEDIALLEQAMKYLSCI